MKNINSRKIMVSVISLLAIGSMVVLASVTVPASTAYAAGDTLPHAQPTNKPTDVGKQPTKDTTKETGKPTDTGKPDNDKESGLYKRAETAVRENQIHIDLANKIVTKTQEWIDELIGKGKDVTALQAALTEFKAQIAIAQQANNEAKTTLQSPTGFESGGQVKDREQARQTVLKLAKDLRDVKKSLDKATFDFRRALTGVRQALNGKTPEPTKKP